MVGEGSIVQWRLAFVVEGIEADVVLEENIHNSVLSVVTCHMRAVRSQHQAVCSVRGRDVCRAIHMVCLSGYSDCVETLIPISM